MSRAKILTDADVKKEVDSRTYASTLRESCDEHQSIRPVLAALAVVRCIALGCPNEVVRVLTHKQDERVMGGLCAHHVRRAILYLTPEQVGGLVFPQAPVTPPDTPGLARP